MVDVIFDFSSEKSSRNFSTGHIPVLQKEVLEYLNPKPNENFIDCTINGGGHSLAILGKIGPQGKILGIDVDPEVIKNLKATLRGVHFASSKIVLVIDSFANLKEIVKYTKFGPVDEILLDLGMSSWHLEKSGRGFSFMRNEPLDMRYGTGELTAEKILNDWSQEKIERILREYGEERFARRLARKIIQEREAETIKTSLRLVDVVKKAKVYSLARIFQALRIAVNDELNNLRKVLPQAIEILKPGGRICIISFHSLEDRIIKNFFRNSNLRVLTKKPITASLPEIKINPRCRSAKLRAAVKL